MRRTARASSVLAAITLVATAGSTPAYAGGNKWYEPPTRYDETFSYDPECETQFLVEGRERGVFSLKVTDDGQAFPFTNTFRVTETWTNTTTGRTLSVSAVGHARETVIEQVALEDVPPELVPAEGLVGPVYRFKVVLTGKTFTVRDEAGKTVVADRGSATYVDLFDTLGDSTPGGTYLDSKVVKTRGTFPSLEPDFDLCALAAELTS